MFQASANADQGTGLNLLDMPYIGPANIQKIEIAEVNDTPNCFSVEFGNFTGTDIQGGSQAGKIFNHTEWAPKDGESAEDTQKKIDRIVYICSKVAPKETLLAIQAANWVEYLNKVLVIVNQAQYVGKTVYIKAMGNVWEGKPRVKFPGYRSFISVENDLTFSAKESAQNQEYITALTTPSAAGAPAGATTSVENAGF